MMLRAQKAMQCNAMQIKIHGRTDLVAAGDGVAAHPASGRPAEAPDGAGAEHVRLRDAPDGHGPIRARLPGRRRPQLDAGARGGGVIAGEAAGAVVSLGPRRRLRQWPLPAQPWVVEGRLQVRRHAVDDVAVGALQTDRQTDTPTTEEERSLSVSIVMAMRSATKQQKQSNAMQEQRRRRGARTCLDGPERRLVEPLEQRLHPPVPPELVAGPEPLRVVLRRGGRGPAGGGKKKRDEQEAHEVSSGGARRRTAIGGHHRRRQCGVDLLMTGL